MSPLIYRSAFSLCAFFVLANLSYSVTAQTLLDVNFDQRSVSTLTETDIENDFGELRFTNGVDEGRVEIVRGQQAFGGSGASLKVDFDANGEGPREGGLSGLSNSKRNTKKLSLSTASSSRMVLTLFAVENFQGLPADQPPAEALRLTEYEVGRAV